MAINRKLGRKTAHRLSMLKNLTTSLIWNGRVETTVEKAKEVKAIADSLISLACREKDNFEMVEVKVSHAKLDSKGKRVTEKATSKNGNDYYKIVREIVTEQRQKDNPKRLAARRKLMRNINKVKDKDGKNVDLVSKMFGEIAAKYNATQGGYTRIIKVGQRKGDAAETAILELV